jgi:hypothetical protein
MERFTAAGHGGGLAGSRGSTCLPFLVFVDANVGCMLGSQTVRLVADEQCGSAPYRLGISPSTFTKSLAGPGSCSGMHPAQQNSTAAHMSATVSVAKDYGDLPLGPVFT